MNLSKLLNSHQEENFKAQQELDKSRKDNEFINKEHSKFKNKIK